jgi:DNA primase
MILDAAYEIHGRGETPGFEALRDDLEDPRARAVLEHLNDLQEGLQRPEPQPLGEVQFPIGTWEARLEDLLALFAERERLARLQDLKQALDETDKQTEPDAYRALQLEYRRLLTQRAGTSNKKHTRPDPTYRA